MFDSIFDRISYTGGILAYGYFVGHIVRFLVNTYSTKEEK